MILEIDAATLKEIHSCGERFYPEEGAGLLLGEASAERKRVKAALVLPNTRAEPERRNRYLLTPQDYLQAEKEAERLEMQVVGVFHSHPDHPNQPSDFDREWALPWFSYIITSVQNGQAVESRSWALTEDRTGFSEEKIVVR
ncbi:MAG: M67 family metallopeptidase [Anaerolineales bacterium]|nr:M67 family metallopeptidase [Anaerolineales bacterium]